MSNRNSVTINATVSGRAVTQYDVESALRTLASEYGARLDGLTVTVAPQEPTVQVELTESEHAAFQMWRASNAQSA
jgi:hypothetical protein